jgi:hypothetical protein
MTGDKWKFSTLKEKSGGIVNFGGKDQGKIIGVGDITTIGGTVIENVLLVSGLKHNLISISQLCDKGYKVQFDDTYCAVLSKHSSEIKLFGKRANNVYTIDLNELPSSGVCLMANKLDEACL